MQDDFYLNKLAARAREINKREHVGEIYAFTLALRRYPELAAQVDREQESQARRQRKEAANAA